MNKPQILVVEDEAFIAANLIQILISLGYTVHKAVAKGEDAVNSVKIQKPDLILMDIELIGALTGIETAEKIRAIADIPIVYLTAYSDDERLKKAQITEPYGYLVKPVHNRELKATIEMALYKHALNRKLKERDDTIRTLLNAVSDDLVLINSGRKIIAINKSMAEKLGQKPKELIGRAIGDFLNSQVLSEILDRIINSHETDRQTHFEEKQNDRWVETLVYPVIGGSENDLRIAIQSHDITLRKQFEEDLKNEGLTQIGQNMEQFQILNDQIRNPLQVIRGYVLLDTTRYSDAINKQVEIIDDLVTQLDIGWLKSEKVSQFLIKHQHVFIKSIQEK